MKSKTLGLLAVALLVEPIWANAAPVTYDFTVGGGVLGPLAGVTASGYFTFDDSIIPPGGGTLLQTGLLIDLVFTWNGIAYTESTANTGSLSFDSGGVLTDFLVGTNCTAGGCGVAVGFNQWFITNAGDEGFSYTLLSQPTGNFDGPVSISLQESSAPEPATLALLGLGLAGLAATRRRKRNCTLLLSLHTRTSALLTTNLIG